MKLSRAVKLAKQATDKAGMIGLRSHGDGLDVFAGSPSMQIRARCDLADLDIDAAVDARRLSTAVSKFGDYANITAKEGAITIKEGRSRVSIEASGTDMIPEVDDSLDTVETTPGTLDAIQQVAFTADVDDVREYLNGVYVSPDAIVATNGHVMAYRALEQQGGDYAGTIINTKAIPALLSIADNLCIGRKVYGIGEGAEIAINPIDGQFPDWRKAIPNSAHTLTFDRAEMLDALDKVTIVAADKTFGVLVDIGEGIITFETTGKGQSSGQAAVDCEGGTTVQIGMNAQYLRDSVAAMQSDTVTMGYSDASTAVTLTDGELNVVVMPMRL